METSFKFFVLTQGVCSALGVIYFYYQAMEEFCNIMEWIEVNHLANSPADIQFLNTIQWIGTNSCERFPATSSKDIWTIERRLSKSDRSTRSDRWILCQSWRAGCGIKSGSIRFRLNFAYWLFQLRLLFPEMAPKIFFWHSN